MINIAVVSGRHPSTLFASPTNHRIYCDHHNLTYIHCNWPSKASNPYLNKLHYINEYIDHFDYLFWIDDDAFFLDLEKDLRTLLPSEGKFLSACKSPTFKSIKTYLSSGQFGLRCNDTAKAFLRKAMETELNEVKDWWTSDLGYFSNGDQDIMTYLAHSDEYRDGIELHDYKAFNSRFENLEGQDQHDIFILHFTGKKKRKWKHYKRAAHILNSDSSLLSKASTRSYPTAKMNLLRKLRRIIDTLRT